MRCLAEAKESLAVDPARTYLTGESMGGSGTWLIGSRHPTTFAALAPIFGGWDFRIHPNGPFSNPDADRLMERWLAEAHSSFAGAEQLINTPVLVLHGDADEAVDVEFSRHIVGLLQRWHYDVRYLEFPGSGHEDLNSLNIVVPWLLQHQLDREPKRVRIRSVDLSGARSAWLDVVRAQRPLAMIEVDAEVLAPGQARLDTKNVSQVRLRLPDLLRSADGTLAVTWNGITTRHSPSPSEDDVLLLPAHSPAMTRVKNSVRSGGLLHVFTTPFVLVIGTISDDEAMNELLSAKAEQFVQLWQTWQHVRPRVIRDVHLTDREAAGYSLVLLGGPETNAITRRLAGNLPFTIEPDRVVIDGRNFSVDDAVAEMVYPSPLSADRYIMLVASTSAEGMWLWDPSQYWRPATGQPTNFYDWIIADARVPMLEPGLLEERGWVASGVFDTNWRRGDEFTFLGDASARADAPVRRSTDHGVTLAPEDLARLTGSYNLPDTPAILEVREIDGHLELAAPGEPALRLLARSPNRLVTSDHRTVLSFSDEAHSCTLSLERAGQRATWRRIGAIGIDCASD